MANIILYNPASSPVANQVTDYLKSVDTPYWAGQPNCLFNPIVPVSGAPTDWKVENGTTVVEMTQVEKDSITSSDATALISSDKETAKAFFDAVFPSARMARGISHALLDEVNVLRSTVVGIGTGAVTYDPPNLSNNTGATSTPITVPGAAFGDFVDVAAPYNVTGLVVTGYVSAANTVVVRLHNGTGGSVNLAPGNWKVAVRRLTGMAPVTPAENRTDIHAKIDAEP